MKNNKMEDDTLINLYVNQQLSILEISKRTNIYRERSKTIEEAIEIRRKAEEKYFEEYRYGL